MPRRDFHTAMDDAARALDTGPSPAAERRLRARLNGDAPRPRIRWSRVALVTAAAAAMVLVTVQQAAMVRPTPAVPPSSLGGFAVLEPSADLAAAGPGDLVKLVAGRCTLRDEHLGAALALGSPATVRRLPDGVEVQSGTVTLDVDHSVARAAPYRVRVSDGEIVVLGTRFTVTQRPGAGSVTLERGSIRFKSDDGQVKLLEPGQSLQWPLPKLAELVPPAPPVVVPNKPPLVHAPKDPVQPRETVLVEKTFDPEELLNRIAVLRSRGQYDEAVTALTSALREGHPASTNERLSFELGAILTRQLADKARACAHWRRHLIEFPQGRYDREVSQARSQLACEN